MEAWKGYQNLVSPPSAFRVRLKPNILKAPASYKFVLRASDASGSTGESSVVIQLNAPPSNSMLVCSPSYGTSLETLFALGKGVGGH